MLVGRLNPLAPVMKAWSPVVLRAKFWICSAGIWLPWEAVKLSSLISCPTSGAAHPGRGGLCESQVSDAFGGEKPKSPSSAYSTAPFCTGPPTNELGTKSRPVKDESAASMASGEVIAWGGNASTSRIGTSSERMSARLATVHLLGGLAGSNTHRSSLGPPIGLNTA